MINAKELEFFKEREFRGYYHDCNPRLLISLDLFRFHWGDVVDVSEEEGAIARFDESESQHNVNKWGEVRAIDVKPRNLITKDDLQHAFSIAKKVGFTGIGLYPEWSDPGLHLDIRMGRQMGSPLYWGAYYDDEWVQQYVYWEEGKRMAYAAM